MGIVRAFAVLVAVGAVAWVGFDRLGGEVIMPGLPPLPVVGTTGGESLPGDAAASPERRFARALDAAAEQARELVRLGETKSRNLPEILGGQRRMTARLDEIDALVGSGALPEDARDAVAAYEDGARAVREAMDQAESGFLKLDFDKVRNATDRMRDGERDLAQAARLLPE